MAALALPEELARRLLDHALAELPNEACAMLSGEAARGAVTSLHVTRNAAASPYRFELDPADLVRVIHAIESAGEDLVAIFHSHPVTQPEPSPADLREARYDVPYVIAGPITRSASTQALRAWRFVAGQPVEVPLLIGARG